jgi:hypothetical protein
VEVNLILNIEVCSPVADLGRSFELGHFQYWVVVIVMYYDRLLVFGDKIAICRRCNVVVRSIGNSCAGLSDRIFQSEAIKILWRSVRDYTRTGRPKNNVMESFIHPQEQSVAYLILVRCTEVW